MTADLFEPFVADLEIRVQQPSASEYRSVLRGIFTTMAAETIACLPDFVGHLKGFCRGESTDYLRISFVSTQTGVDITGEWRHDPECARLTINMNVLGLQQHDFEQLLESAVSQHRSDSIRINTLKMPVL
jgi:hypothetical protein